MSKMFQNIASIDRQMKRIEKTSHEKCIENFSLNRNVKKQDQTRINNKLLQICTISSEMHICDAMRTETYLKVVGNEN